MFYPINEMATPASRIKLRMYSSLSLPRERKRAQERAPTAAPRMIELYVISLIMVTLSSSQDQFC